MRLTKTQITCPGVTPAIVRRFVYLVLLMTFNWMIRRRMSTRPS